jgi:membrane protein implicated in regulation of membrane protease activity
VKLFWLIIAGGCVAVAAVFLLRGDFDIAFVVAAAGMVAWFLNYRMQVRAALTAKDSDQDQNDDGGDCQNRER